MNNDFFEKAAAYLAGTMTAGEKLQFEKLLAADEELQDMLDTNRLIETKMPLYKKYENDEADFKKHLERFRADYFGDKKEDARAGEPGSSFTDNASSPIISVDKGHKGKKFGWKQYAAAAGIVGIITLSITWYTHHIKTQQPSVADNKPGVDRAKQVTGADSIQPKQIIPDGKNLVAKDESGGKNHKKDILKKAGNAGLRKLYASNFKPDAVPEETKGPLADAYYYYQSNRYKEALIAIENVETQELTRGAIGDTSLNSFYKPYYTAQCLMATGAVERAIPELKKAIVESPDEIYSVKAKWYLSLAYLQIGNSNNAKEMLQQIIGRKINNAYTEKAASLLELIR